MGAIKVSIKPVGCILLLREAFEKPDPKVVDRYITASLKHDNLMGNPHKLEQAVTEHPFNGITPIHDVPIKRFGTSPMATAMYYMFMVPNASAITREMIQNNQYFDEKVDFVTALGGKLTIDEVKPYGEFSGFFDDEIETPDRLLSGLYRGSTPESLGKAIIDGNIYCLKGAGYVALPPAVGVGVYLMTQDTSNTLVASAATLGFLLTRLMVKEDEVHAGFTNMEMALMTLGPRFPWP